MLGLTALVVVVVGVLGFVIYQSVTAAPTVQATSVKGATPHYGVVLGKSDAKASMVIYEDFQCPVCRAFENLRNGELMSDVADGTLRVEYRPIALLDQMSSSKYSTRALSASACVLNGTDRTVWKTFHDLLYTNQPAENSPGLTDIQLADYAAQAGATSTSVRTCITDETYTNYASSATLAASKVGVLATPTVLLNGKTMSNTTYAHDAAFTAAIQNAAGGSTK